MMRGGNSSRETSNFALELVRTAKRWTLDLIKTTRNAPSSTLGSMLSFLPFANGVAEGKEPRTDLLLDHYLQELETSFTSADPAQEQSHLKELERFLSTPSNKKEQQLGFLLQFYVKLNKLAVPFRSYTPHATQFSGDKDPRLQINAALMNHCREDYEMAKAVGMFPAQLNDLLCQQEAQLGKASYMPVAAQPEPITVASLPDSPPVTSGRSGRKPASPLKRMSIVFRQPPGQAPQRAVQPVANGLPDDDWADSFFHSASGVHRSREKATPPVPESKITHNIPPVINLNGTNHSLPPLVVERDDTAEEKTLQRYQKASKEYATHLLAAILDEIEPFYRSQPRHALFNALHPRGDKNDSHTLTLTLLNFYYHSPSRRLSTIDDAINSAPLKFRLAWEKYKIVKALSESTSTKSFTDNVSKHKNTLTQHRTTAFMKWVKCCGLVVATLLGLPLGLVGGYLLAHRSLFGARATQGHLFLMQVDEIKAESTKPKRPR